MALKLQSARSSVAGQRFALSPSTARVRQPVRPIPARRPARLTSATAQAEVKGDNEEPKPKPVFQNPLKSKNKADVYIGNGRTIRDDPAKYPDRDELTGGWAGGELGLWQFRDEAKADAQAAESGEGAGLDISKVTGILSPFGKADNDAEEFTAKVNGKEVKGAVKGTGNDIIYIGNETFIKDEGRKYPDKEDLGILYGATGGFAGGEEGLKKYIETGEIPLAPPGQKGRSQVSPLLFVFGTGALAGVVAFAYLSGSDEDLVSGVISGGANIAAAPANADLPTKVAAGAAAVLVIGLAGKSAIQSTWKKVKVAADSTARYALFAGLLVLAIKAVLDS